MMDSGPSVVNDLLSDAGVVRSEHNYVLQCNIQLLVILP